MEKNYKEPTDPKPETQQQLGSTALLFINPFSGSSYLDNPNTYLGSIVEEEAYDEIEAPSDEIVPSYAKSSEDYRLLLRKQRSNSNRAKRARKKHR